MGDAGEELGGDDGSNADVKDGKEEAGNPMARASRAGKSTLRGPGVVGEGGGVRVGGVNWPVAKTALRYKKIKSNVNINVLKSSLRRIFFGKKNLSVCREIWLQISTIYLQNLVRHLAPTFATSAEKLKITSDDCLHCVCKDGCLAVI